MWSSKLERLKRLICNNVLRRFVVNTVRFQYYNIIIAVFGSDHLRNWLTAVNLLSHFKYDTNDFFKLASL